VGGILLAEGDTPGGESTGVRLLAGGETPGWG
jgi:hypothetical protein